jgi:hypothetical protein
MQELNVIFTSTQLMNFIYSIAQVLKVLGSWEPSEMDCREGYKALNLIIDEMELGLEMANEDEPTPVEIPPHAKFCHWGEMKGRGWRLNERLVAFCPDGSKAPYILTVDSQDRNLYWHGVLFAELALFDDDITLRQMAAGKGGSK